MMVAELDAILSAVPRGSSASEYRDSVLEKNVVGKATVSTRRKTLRHMRELYALDESTAIFGLLRKLHAADARSLAHLAVLVAWSRDPLMRATTAPVMEALEGDRVETASLALAVESTFPEQYSELNRNKIARNAASSWTQSGHLVGRTKKTRGRIIPASGAVTMALFLGHIAGYHGASVFGNPWCHLLDLSPDRAQLMGFEAHRAGLLNLRAVGDVVELTFPSLVAFQGESS